MIKAAEMKMEMKMELKMEVKIEVKMKMKMEVKMKRIQIHYIKNLRKEFGMLLKMKLILQNQNQN